MKKHTSIGVYQTIRTVWETAGPIKISVNRKVVFDDYTFECKNFESAVEELFKRIEKQYEGYYVTSIKLKIVSFHHTEVNIKAISRKI